MCRRHWVHVATGLQQAGCVMRSQGLFSDPSQACIDVDRGAFAAGFGREPFGLAHNLHELDLFEADALTALARRYDGHPRDVFVAASAPRPDTEFYAVPALAQTAFEAMQTVNTAPCRLLLKRPENHDPRFRVLLDTLFAQLVGLQPGLGRARIVRLEATILVSSAAATTPFHFDPEINCFAQIEGDKTYHVYSPAVLEEPELERFYAREVVDIGRAELAGRDPGREHVFKLAPGLGLQHPQNAPHWVETGAARSVSYSYVVVTDRAHRLGRTRSFNHYARKLGMTPTAPLLGAVSDAFKARAMDTLTPVRRGIGALVGRKLGR